ncbi:MAG: hypothetical protein NPINA01_25380 [Nitrospinaceae bacterium]|nr:MAG: hypothetical protein NPINA01_25380 [Nitrospinaceae bacterium]
MKESKDKNILIVGATGYIGQKLIQRLKETGNPIRCLVRNPRSFKENPSQQIQIQQGDLIDFESIKNAFTGIDTAFYLVHSLDVKRDFEKQEQKAATNFANAAKSANIKRIIYLGALGNEEEGPLSPHLQSRKEVGNILRSSGVPVLEFQASIILGSGSLSFEMIRTLSERLPAMLMPKWVFVKAQPIGVADVLEFLMQGIDIKMQHNEIIEIGGPEQVSYKDLISEYCRQRKLQRLLIPVPVLTPWLSSLWLELVTPIYARVGRKLVESIKNPTVVKNDKASRVFPGIHPRGISEAIGKAIHEAG